VIQNFRQRAWWGLWLLMFLLPAAPCTAAAPNLVGNWQGSSPGIFSTYCINEAVTLNIVQHCGNLFRGSATVAGSTQNVVGSIKDGTSINIHGTTAGGETFMIFGDYQAGAPPKINVIFFYPDSLLEREYDNFQLSYGGAPKIKGGSAALKLLLLD
jgi:hypothetical protein